MKRAWVSLFCLLLFASLAWSAFAPSTGVISDERWASGVPLGGIGCGKLEYFTDGSFGRFTGNHNWDRPTGLLRGAFFALWQKSAGKSDARLLRLPVPDEYANVADLAHCDYLGLFPFATFTPQLDESPLELKIEAFAPLIAHNVKDSSLPVATFTVTLRNRGTLPVEVALAFAWPNLLGWGGDVQEQWQDFSTNYQAPAQTRRLVGLAYRTSLKYTDRRQNTVGEYFVGVQQAPGLEVQRCLNWDAAAKQCGFWKEFSASGRLPARTLPRSKRAAEPAGAVAARLQLAPGAKRRVVFVLTWAMPNFITEQTKQVPVDEWESTPADNAVDGKLSTRWSTNRPMIAGDALEITLDSPQPLSALILDDRSSTGDYPRGYELLAQTASGWQVVAKATAEQATRAQNDGLLVIPVGGVKAKALKLVVQGGDNYHFFSADEVRLEIATDAGRKLLQLAPGQVKGLIRLVRKSSQYTDYGHYYLNYWSSAEAIADYVTTRLEDLKHATRASWQAPVLESNLPFWLKLKLVNVPFTLFADTVLTRDRLFAVQESPRDMQGALGTMDQRMAAHAFYTQLFPELDEAELRLFAKCQQPDGRITHFDGNIHQVIGDPNVPYGITDWPDLSCSWVMQVEKLYRWTGDEAFLEQMWPHLQRAMAWLKAADWDGDAIPEGGSTYDYEHLPRGAFSYTASCYLGALEHAIAAAKAKGDQASARRWQARLQQVQQSVLKELWDPNLDYFIKWYGPVTPNRKAPQRVANSFVAQLAGDWFTHLTGLGYTLPEAKVEAACRQLIVRHLNSFFPVPPMEVKPEGKLFTHTCYLLQHEPYLGCEAIYNGFVDAGLETLRRVYLCAWLGNHNPWNESLAYEAPSGGQGGLVSYMTCPTSYHVLSALAGASLDVPHQTLYLSPKLPSGLKRLEIPLFMASFSAWLDYAPPSHCKLRILDVYSKRPLVLKWVRIDDQHPALPLPKPFTVKEGAVLDLGKLVSKLAPAPYSKEEHAALRSAPPVGPGLSPAKWDASWGSKSGTSPLAWSAHSAFDRQESTRWTTGRKMEPGDWFLLDLGEIHSVQRLVLDCKPSPDDYPRGYKLYVSKDAHKWRLAAQASADDCAKAVHDGVLEIVLPKPHEARYLKLVQQGVPERWRFWSIHEIFVFGK